MKYLQTDIKFLCAWSLEYEGVRGESLKLKKQKVGPWNMVYNMLSCFLSQGQDRWCLKQEDSMIIHHVDWSREHGLKSSGKENTESPCNDVGQRDGAELSRGNGDDGEHRAESRRTSMVRRRKAEARRKPRIWAVAKDWMGAPDPETGNQKAQQLSGEYSTS